MDICYDYCGGYFVGDYHINNSSGRWEIKSNLDSMSEHTTETFKDAIDWCLDKEVYL